MKQAEPIISSVGVAISVHHQVRAAIATSHAAAAAAATHCVQTYAADSQAMLGLLAAALHCSRNCDL